MIPHFLDPPTKNQKEEPDKHVLVHYQGPEHNTAEGSEFLDDAIRMRDQPLIYTEGHVSPGCPDNML